MTNATTDTPSADLRAVAVVSVLHEPAGANSATRRFRTDAVLTWTLARLARCRRVPAARIACWDDQSADALAAADASGHGDCVVMPLGPRGPLPEVDAIAAARRWSDGWRGGPLGATEFDRGFHGPTVAAVLDDAGADAAVLVDPAAALVDPGILDALVARAAERPDLGYAFAPAAPGLGGLLLRASIVAALASKKMHPGRLLTYHPANPVPDPIAAAPCVSVPAPVARTTRRYALDSNRAVGRVTGEVASLNGTLIDADAASIVALDSTSPHAGAKRSAAEPRADDAPREVVLELTTRRATSPTFWPGRHLPTARPDLSPAVAADLFDQFCGVDDLRLTLAGVGDPLLHPHFREIVAAAHDAGIRAIAVETDLLPDSAGALDALAGVDVVSVALPAMTPATYAAVMGADRMAEALRNLRALLVARAASGGKLPLIVPTFARVAANAGEMEDWYDHWSATLDGAVMKTPGRCGGAVPDLGGPDLAPPGRAACRRLWDRFVVLCDGRVTTCEEDAAGVQSVGRLGEMPALDLWQRAMRPVRDDHRLALYDARPVCRDCREWHRP